MAGANKILNGGHKLKKLCRCLFASPALD